MTRLDGPEVDVRGDGCEGSKIGKGCPRSGDKGDRPEPGRASVAVASSPVANAEYASTLVPGSVKMELRR